MALTKTRDVAFGVQSSLQNALAMGMKLEVGEMAFDSEYATGGEAITFPDMPRKIMAVVIQPKGGYVFDYDRTNAKVIVYGQASNVLGALTQIAASVDLSALSNVPYQAWGY